MTRSLLRACVVISLVMALAPPAAAESKWELGVKGGLTFAAIRGAMSDLRDSRVGFCAGGFIARDLGNLSMLQLEALYISKGGKDADALDALAETVTINYLEIPLLAKLIIPTTKKKPSYFAGEEGLRPNIYVGPFVAFKLNNYDNITDSDFKVKDFDYGIAFGGGFDVDVYTGKIVMDIRYTLGLKKIADYDSNPDFKNGVMMMMVGYLF